MIKKKIGLILATISILAFALFCRKSFAEDNPYVPYMWEPGDFYHVYRISLRLYLTETEADIWFYGFINPQLLLDGKYLIYDWGDSLGTDTISMWFLLSPIPYYDANDSLRGRWDFNKIIYWGYWDYEL